jgi:hypothetical protein
MTKTEAIECVSFAIQLFPMAQLSDAEISLLAQRLERFELDDVRRAIQQHRMDNPRRKPDFKSIMGACREIAASKRTGPPIFKSHGEILGEQMQCDPIEATLRYWRGQWFEYAKQAQRNEANIRRSVPEGPLLDLAISKWRVQRDGSERKCRSGCRSGIVECRIPIGEAERWAESIFSAPHDFKLAIEDLRQNGVELIPLPADSYREELEGTMPVFADGVSVPEFS